MTKVKIAMLFLAAAFGASAQGNNSLQTSKPLTPEQVTAVHGKLFQQGSPGQIPQQLAATQGDVILRPFGTSSEIGIDIPLEWKFVNLTCQNDVVVVGKAGSSSSHPTAGQGFVYSDWQFTVDRVFKDNARAPVSGGATIVVTRPGGTLEIDGRKVYAKLNHFRDFVAGEELLLYLQFVPETGAYLMRQPNFYRISDTTLKSARDGISESAKSCLATLLLSRRPIIPMVFLL